MSCELVIRKIEKQDLMELKVVIDSSELFPSEYLDELINPYFNDVECEDIWFTALKNNIPVAIGYCAPEKFTCETYNLKAIGVIQGLQGQGIGKRLMEYIEAQLKENNKRILIVETSSLDKYKLTRTFYIKVGYKQEATIRDFWNEGEDKIVFWKKLNIQPKK